MLFQQDSLKEPVENLSTYILVLGVNTLYRLYHIYLRRVADVPLSRFRTDSKTSRTSG